MSDPKKKNPYTQSRISSYQRTDVLTANRETILLMMYSAAIRNLKLAIKEIEQKDSSKRTEYIQKTLDIVNEFRSTLNHDIGGDIASSLEQLYHFITQRIVEGNLNRDSKPLKEALEVLSTLNNAWEEAIASLKKERNEDVRK